MVSIRGKDRVTRVEMLDETSSWVERKWLQLLCRDVRSMMRVFRMLGWVIMERIHPEVLAGGLDL